MRLKEIQIKEAATAGATAAGNIAAVVNPHVANPSRKSVAYTGKPGGPSGEGPVAQYVAKKQKPTDNALDGDALLMSSKEPQMIRRQIKEGSLYEEQLNEIIKELIAGVIVINGVMWLKDKFGNWFKSEKGKTQVKEGSLYEESLLEYTKSVLCKQCLAMVEAGVETMETCKQYCGELETKEKEEDDSPWWKFWDDANIPRTEREAIGIIQEAMKMRNEGLRIEPRGEAGKANAFKQMMANVSKNKETRAINTEKSKRQAAQAAGYRAIVGGKDVSQIAKGFGVSPDQIPLSNWRSRVSTSNPLSQRLKKKTDEGLRIEKRLPDWLPDWRKKANQEASGITDIEKAAGASKPTNQGQTDVEKSTIADVDRTTLHVEKPKKRIARAPQLGRDA